MKKPALLSVAALALSGCGLVSTPEPLHIQSVDFPATASATEPLTVNVRVQIWNCGEKDQQVTLIERTSSRLSLSGTFRKGWAGPCGAAVLDKVLTYTDAGTPGRTESFEIVVNGKSWGKVLVK